MTDHLKMLLWLYIFNLARNDEKILILKVVYCVTSQKNPPKFTGSFLVYINSEKGKMAILVIFYDNHIKTF